MVVDTSALIAILNNEPERTAFLDKIKEAERCFISALSLYETQIVALARLGERGFDELTQLVDELGFSVVPFDRPQADLCATAYRRFGKGFGPLLRSIFVTAPPTRLRYRSTSPCCSRATTSKPPMFCRRDELPPLIRQGRTLKMVGGAEEDRTPDLCSAIAALSQLSYGPEIGAI
jgi:ribonuclease VapC